MGSVGRLEGVKITRLEKYLLNSRRFIVDMKRMYIPEIAIPKISNSTR